MNLHVMYDFEFIINCQCRFINSNKCAALVKNVDRMESVLSKNKAVWGKHLLSLQFYCETNCSKYKVYLNNYLLHIQRMHPITKEVEEVSDPILYCRDLVKANFYECLATINNIRDIYYTAAWQGWRDRVKNMPE